MEVIDLTADSSSEDLPKCEQYKTDHQSRCPTTILYDDPPADDSDSPDPQLAPVFRDNSDGKLWVRDTNITIIDIDADTLSEEVSTADRKRKRSTSTLERADASPEAPLHPLLVDGDDDTPAPPTRKRRSASRTSAAVTVNPDTFEFTHHFKLCSTQGNNLVSIQDEFTLTYTSSLSSLTAWTSHLPSSCTLGFDTEGDAQVVQLCCLITSKMLIFMMPRTASPSYKAQCAAILSTIIGSESYLKVGIAAFEDAIKLRRAMDVESAGIFDLTYLARDLRINQATGETSRTFQADTQRGIVVISDDGTTTMPLNAGLKALFRDLFTSNFSQIVSSDGADYRDPCQPGRNQKKWTTYPLRKTDLLYAAKDALFGSLLYNGMIVKYSDDEVRGLKADAATALEKRKKKAARKACHVVPSVPKSAGHMSKKDQERKRRKDVRSCHDAMTKTREWKDKSHLAHQVPSEPAESEFKTETKSKKQKKKEKWKKQQREAQERSSRDADAQSFRIKSEFETRPRIKVEPGRMLQ